MPEDALRIFPAWEVRAFGLEIPNQFFPAVLLPGLTFGLLYAWPFLEVWATKDRDRTTSSTVRATGRADGARRGTLSFYAVLFFAASNDLVAKWLAVPVDAVSWVFREPVLVVPPVAGIITYQLMSALKRSGAERLSRLALSDLRRAPRGEPLR